MTPETIAEIRNALTIIKGNAQVIMEHSADGPMIHDAAVINAQVDRIVKLLEEK